MQAKIKRSEGKQYNIYPTLLVTDRIFDIPGINFVLNRWFGEELAKLGTLNVNVMDLVVIDIDTLIFYKKSLSKNEKKFRSILRAHYTSSKSNTKGYGKNEAEIYKNAYNKVIRKIAPFSSRFDESKFDRDFFFKFTLDAVDEV